LPGFYRVNTSTITKTNMNKLSKTQKDEYATAFAMLALYDGGVSRTNASVVVVLYRLLSERLECDQPGTRGFGCNSMHCKYAGCCTNRSFRSLSKERARLWDFRGGFYSRSACPLMPPRSRVSSANRVPPRSCQTCFAGVGCPPWTMLGNVSRDRQLYRTTLSAVDALET